MYELINLTENLIVPKAEDGNEAQAEARQQKRNEDVNLKASATSESTLEASREDTSTLSQSESSEEDWCDTLIPTLNLIPENLVPGIWMRRELVDLWVQAQNICADFTAVCYKNNAALKVYRNLIDLKVNYINYLNHYSDESRWLMNQSDEDERKVKELELNYKLMHLYLIKTVTYCPAIIINHFNISRTLVEEFSGNTQVNKISQDASQNTAKAPHPESTLNEFIINTLFLSNIFLKNAFLITDVDADALEPSEYINNLLKYINNLTLNFSNHTQADIYEQDTLSLNSSPSEFLNSLRLLDIKILSSKKITTTVIIYFIERLTYFCFFQSELNEQSNLNDLTHLLFKTNTLIKEFDSKQNFNLILILKIITDIVIKKFDSLPEVTVAIKNLLYLNNQQIINHLNTYPEQTSDLALTTQKLNQKIQHQEYKDAPPTPYSDSVVQTLPVWIKKWHRNDDQAEKKTITKNKTQIKMTPEVVTNDFFLLGISTLPCWKTSVLIGNKMRAKTALMKQENSEFFELKKLSEHASESAGIIKLAIEEEKEIETGVREKSLQTLENYHQFMKLHPHHWYLIRSLVFMLPAELKTLYTLIIYHENINRLKIRIGEYHRYQAPDRMKETYKTFECFIRDDEETGWKKKLDTIFNELDTFIDNWSVNIIFGHCHQYIIDIKLDSTEQKGIWQNVNATCLSVLNWYAALFCQLTIKLKPEGNEDNYLKRCIRWGRLLAAMNCRMKNGSPRDCYQIMLSRKNHIRKTLTHEELQVLQILEPFYDENISELTWAGKLNELSFTPQLNDYNYCADICIGYAYSLFDKHLKRLHSPDIKAEHWTESKNILQLIAKFCLQGDLAYHWHQHIKLNPNLHFPLKKLISVIEESQKLLLYRPPGAEEAPLASSADNQDSACLSQQPARQNKTKKTKHRKKTKLETENKFSAHHLSPEDNGDLKNTGQKDETRQENQTTSEARRLLYQAERLILYEPKQAISTFDICNIRVGSERPELSQRITSGLTESSIRLLKPVLQKACSQTHKIQYFITMQTQAINNQTYTINPASYNSMMKIIEQSYKICEEVHQLAELYLPYIANFLEIPIAISITSDSEKQNSLLMIRVQCEEVNRLLYMFMNYMNLIDKCIRNRKMALDMLGQMSKTQAEVSQQQQQRRRDRTELIHKTISVIESTRKDIHSLNQIWEKRGEPVTV